MRNGKDQRARAVTSTQVKTAERRLRLQPVVVCSLIFCLVNYGSEEFILVENLDFRKLFLQYL